MAACGRPPTLGETVEAVRARLFVGRQDELAMLERAITAARDRPTVVCVHGPAGVGKSTLLRAFAREASLRRVPVASIDLAVLDGSPEGLLYTLSRELAAHLPHQGEQGRERRIAERTLDTRQEVMGKGCQRRPR